VAGESLWSIARSWNACELPTVVGGPWSSHVLRQVISSPRVAGMREHKGSVVAGGNWPPILDTETWQAVQSRLATHRRVPGSQARTSYLAGLLRCAVCGKHLRSVRTSNKARAYACRPGPGLGGCGKVKIAAAPVERKVKEIVIGTLIDPLNLQRLMDMGADRESEKDGPPKAERINVAQAKLDRLKDLYVDGEITRPDYNQRKTIIEDEITAIISDDPMRRTLTDLPSSAAAFETRWEDGGVPFQQAMARLVITGIVVSATSRRGPGLDESRLAWSFV
jgi:site-specific DNA recombinase